MISTKGRYAIRVMIDLAEHDEGKYIPLKDIAARQEISKKYLEIIVKDMVAGGPVACLAEEVNDCPRKGACKTLPLWTEFDTLVHDFFYQKKLSDLINKEGRA